MVRRRDLKRIACGIAQSFINRDNDIDGYWGPGKLYTVANGLGVRELTIALWPLPIDAVHSIPEIEVVARRYREALFRHLNRERLTTGHIRRVEILVSFNTHGSKTPPHYSWGAPFSWGDPFLCTVSILDDLGRLRSAETVSRCSPHDPIRELRRAGFHSSEGILARIKAWILSK